MISENFIADSLPFLPLMPFLGCNCAERRFLGIAQILSASLTYKK
jgi:hypothetical protein